MEIEVFDSNTSRIKALEERVDILKAWIRWVIETQRLNSHDEETLIAVLNPHASYPPKVEY